MNQEPQGRGQPQKWQSRIIGQGMEQADQLLANPLNWRKHPKAQQAALKGALNEIGWIQQVIVNKTTGHLVDGHLRVEVALSEGEQEVPVLYVELTEEEEKKALATIDPISAMATTDRKMLDDLILGLNVEDQDFGQLLDALASQDALNNPTDGLTDDDAVGEKTGHTITESGDVFILGEHRLLCGDGTESSCVAQLMDGQQADMCWTDPPYNVDYEGKTKDALKIDNDKMSNENFYLFLLAYFSRICEITKPGGPIYIAHADSEGLNFRQAMINAGFEMKQCLVWVKNTSVMGRQDYHWQHEPILYGWKPGAAHSWYGERDKKTVISADKPAANRDHPTMKPVALIEQMVRNSSQTGDLVVDFCGGSGSTLITCQKYGRRCFTMEIDPHYCDVIIRRWQDYTGKDAVHEATGETFNERQGAQAQ